MMTYEPGGVAPESGPEPATPNSPGYTPARSASPAGSGLPENVAGALAYLMGPITGLIFFFIDRERAFVRFHAVQAIAVTIAWVALAIAVTIFDMLLGVIPVIGWLVGLLLSLGLALAGFGLWLWLMYQAYRGKTWEFPVLGPHVRRIASQTGGEATAGHGAA